MKTFVCLCALLFFAPIVVGGQEANRWEFKGQEDGIKIYHQRTEGLLHIKLTTTFKVPLAGVVTMFSDISTYTDWVYKIMEARLLRRVSDTEMYYYGKYDFPWPMEDRDIILNSKIEQNPNTREVFITNTPYPQYLPENAGIQRIKNTTTQWRFRPGENGQVHVEQIIATDSAEGLPAWLVKLTAFTGPRETAKSIRNLLESERFQRAKLSYIREK